MIAVEPAGLLPPLTATGSVTRRAVHRAVNTAASPLKFEIDGMELLGLIDAIERDGHELGAIYHSHARTAPFRRRPTSTSRPTGPGSSGSSSGSPTGRARGSLLPDRGRSGPGGRDGARVTVIVDDEPLCARPARGRTLRASASARRAGCRSSIPVRAGGDAQEPAGERREQARKIKPQYSEGRLVKVAYAQNQPEAELIQGLLLEEGIPSMPCALPASTSPTSWPPARATCSCPSRASAARSAREKRSALSATGRLDEDRLRRLRW